MPSLTSLISRMIKPSCAVWEITLKCNSNCIHCGSKAGKIRADELNNEEALQLVRDLRDCGYKGVALMGGEPLIREDWYEIAQEIKKNKLELSIVTNGLNLIDNIHKLNQLNVDCVSLSLDGGTAKVHDNLRGISGAFKKTLNAINRLKVEKIPVSVITSVSKTNLTELDKIKNLLLDRDIAWQIQIALPIGRFPRELTISREEFYTVALFIAINANKYSYKRLPIIGGHCFGHYSKLLPNLGIEPWVGCQAGKSVLGIQSNGNIKGCLTLPDEFIEGNIRTQSLDTIVEKIRSKLIKVKGYCSDCEVTSLCRGGCLGTAFALKEFKEPYCLRAIETKLFASKQLPSKGKLDSTISIIKSMFHNLPFK
ncbi:MAG: radical SAM protein [Candidatus Hermodarchaeota archaeon]